MDLRILDWCPLDWCPYETYSHSTYTQSQKKRIMNSVTSPVTQGQGQVLAGPH